MRERRGLKGAEGAKQPVGLVREEEEMRIGRRQGAEKDGARACAERP